MADDVVVVFAGDVFFGYTALFVGSNKTVLLNDGQKFLNGLACERVAAEHHFETVVIRRIVTAGNHHAAAATFVDGCEVEHRGGNHADVEDVDAAVCKTALNLRHQAGAA